MTIKIAFKICYFLVLPAQIIESLADILAWATSPAPMAFPTLTLPAILKPKGN